jgi:S1-C subfamily serine protease
VRLQLVSVVLLSTLSVSSAPAREPSRSKPSRTGGAANRTDREGKSGHSAAGQTAPAPLAGTPAVAPSPPASSSLLPLVSLSPEEVVERALRQTVYLDGDGVYGSGIIVLPRRGLILTNWHVIEEMRSPRVVYHDGHAASARVLEVDKALDLALLEGPAVDAPPLALGDALDLRPAQPLYAIGSPRKLGFTVCRGIVSYVGRLMDGMRYIQTDLPINEGNSGGPVITARGDVVGIMTFILRRSNGLAFALPINYAIERFSGRLAELSVTPTYLSRFKTWKTQ